FLRPWFIRRAVDGGWDRHLVLPLVAGLGAAWVVRFALSGASQYLAGTAALRILSTLRTRVFAHVQSLDVRYFDRTRAGRIIARADRDVDSLEPLLIQGPP